MTASTFRIRSTSLILDIELHNLIIKNGARTLSTESIKDRNALADSTLPTSDWILG